VACPGTLAAPGWLTCLPADIPASDGWLSTRERQALAGMGIPKRRADWRAGRWAGKAVLAAWTGAAVEELEIIASENGAPEAFINGEPLPVALSLSHRGGRSLAVVAGAGVAVGCDLEPIEPRSGAFVRTWLAPSERASVESAGPADGGRLANAIWTSKEAAVKARRGGMLLDTRHAVVELDPRPPDGGGEWRPLGVRWPDEEASYRGWWREEPGWVLAVVSEPPTPAPVAL
jgi:4'-phosphopantetheinyl transferase